MRRVVLAGVGVLALGVLAHETSGQGHVSGRLVTPDGTAVSECLIQRDLRLGFWFGGGFDDLGYMTGTDGRFRLPVARGVNRLTFDCASRGEAEGSTVVWRHLEPDMTVVLSGSSVTGQSLASGSPETERIRAAPRQRIEETDEFGLVASITRSADGSVTVQIDRVDMLGGAEAEAAAAAQADEVSNDYYLVNDNPQLRSYTVPPTAVIWGSIRLQGTPDVARVSFADWVEFVTGEESDDTLFHLDVEDGLVVAVEEQYRP